MENLKNYWLRAITGVSLVLGLILGVHAFEKKVEVKPFLDPDPVTVHFELSTDNEEEIADESNWDGPANPNCGNGQYLCAVTYDRSQYPTLRDFLDANPSQSLIEFNALSVSHKN